MHDVCSKTHIYVVNLADPKWPIQKMNKNKLRIRTISNRNPERLSMSRKTEWISDEQIV